MAASRRSIGLGILLGVGLAGAARADEFNMAVTADGVRLGRSILGPEVGKDGLKGRVVLLKFWGVH